MTDHMQLQRKTVGQSADTLTSVISSTPVSTPTATPQLAPEPPVQTESVTEQTSELSQEPQPSFLNHDFGRLPIFAKLSVSQPNDPYEQEADRVAEQVMRTPDRTPDSSPSVQGFAGHDFGQIALSSQLQPIDDIGIAQTQVSSLAASITLYVQRDALPENEGREKAEAEVDSLEVTTEKVEETKEAEAEEFVQTHLVQRQANQNGVETAQGLERQLAQSRNGGSPLPDETRRFMESSFGVDFSQVRVHTDDDAVQMNQRLQAQAFTHGNNIYFGAGQTPGKNMLTAHELTHTIQQTGQSTNSSNAPMVTDSEQFDSASHHWQPAVCDQIQKSPISAGAVFSIQRQGVSSNLIIEGQDVQQTVSAEMRPPSVEDEKRSLSPRIPERVSPAKENPYKTKPATDKPTASTQDNTQNVKQNHKVVPPTTTGSPANDPDFQAVTARGQQVAQTEQQHEPAEVESREAQDAAQSPTQEVTSQAQDRQVGEMAEQEAGEFNAQAFKDAIFQKLQDATPTNQEEAENFNQDNELDTVRQEVVSDVSQERNQAAAPIEETTQEEPDSSGIEPRRETPMHPPDRGTAPGGIGAERATPKPRSDAEVSQPLEANQQEVDQQMAEADITEEQLANANEPEFSAALDAKREVDADAEQAPNAYRQQEQATLNQAQTDAQNTAATQLAGMHNQRQDSMAQVEGLQGETKSVDEQKRLEIANHINGIYDRVKGEVDTLLNTLETDVTSAFDTAANTARQEFEDYVEREKDNFLFERYTEEGLLVGGVRAVDDFFTGLPPEVEEIFAEGRRRYLDDMSVALDDIAITVADRLNEAMQKIEGGRQDIKKYVDSLPANLRQIGQEAATSIESKFDDLEQQVRDKHDELVDTLAQKYQEHLKEIDSRIEEMKAENRGLFDRAMDAIGGVIQTINEIKAMLQGLLADAMNAIGMILKDPIGFLNNLLKALNQGFNQFLENIGEHLQSGLIGWLTGAMGAAGIQMPENIFSLEGIFSLAAQILGLGWEFIRDKAVGMFDESTVGAMEESVDIFQILKNDGLKGLWQQVQSQFTDLKETVMDEVKSIITVQVMQAGVTWILSLFSPASAFIRAAKMIVDVVIFFVENASQIMELVQAVIQSIAAIASGSIGAAANAIESALARAIPVLIGLLASLLGLGGLANKVRDVFERIRKRIEDAIEKLLQKAKELFKGKNGKDNQEENEQDKNDKENDEENAFDIIAEKQRDTDDTALRQDTDNMESDRDPDATPIDKTNKSDGNRSDEENAPVDLSKPRRTRKQGDDPDSTADSTIDGKGDRRDQDSDVTPDAKRDQYDNQDADAPRRDKSDQPDQRRHDQDEPEQQRRRDRDQDSDSSPDGKRDRDGEDGDRREDDDRTDDEKANSELYHQRLARQAATELKEVEPEDYDTARREAETKARKIEIDYTRRLERGIKLRVVFDPPQIDKEDSGLDFKVVIAPNDTIVTDQIDISDLDTAEEALKKVISESKTTQQVQNNFGQIISKFGLTNIKWSHLGEEAVAVILEKSEIKKRVDPDSGSHQLILEPQAESKQHNLKEEIEFQPGTITTPSGDWTVGKMMEAKRLSPDHPKGEGTNAKSIKNVMRHLPTAITTNAAFAPRKRNQAIERLEKLKSEKKLLEQQLQTEGLTDKERGKIKRKLKKTCDKIGSPIELKEIEKIVPDEELSFGSNQYVAGHLLNDNLGGPNDDRNLYPITHEANGQHEKSVESKIKKWSEVDRYWVYYKVDVNELSVPFDDTGPETRPMTVNSEFQCEAYVLDVSGNPIRSSEFSIEKTIHSRFNEEGGVTDNGSTSNSQSNQKPAIEPPTSSNFDYSTGEEINQETN